MTAPSLQDAFRQQCLRPGLTAVPGGNVGEGRSHHLAVAPVTGQTVVAGQQFLGACGLGGRHGGGAAGGRRSLLAGGMFTSGSGCCGGARGSRRVRTSRTIGRIGRQYLAIILRAGGLQRW